MYYGVCIGLFQALFLLFMAPLFTGGSRCLRARFHSRQGPGLLQDYRDIAHLLRRQSVAPALSGPVFLGMPYVLTGILLVVASALPMILVASPLPAVGDLITLIYLLALARFVFILAGLDAGSPFTTLGAAREAMLGVLVEPILILSVWVVAAIAGSTQLSNMIRSVMSPPPLAWIPLLLAAMACAFATFFETGKLPCDLAEAEQELQEGPLTEYSGASLGILKWGMGLRQLVIMQLFLGLFIPWGEAIALTERGVICALLFAFLKLFFLAALLAVIENSVARLRFMSIAHTTRTGFVLACLAWCAWLIVNRYH